MLAEHARTGEAPGQICQCARGMRSHIDKQSNNDAPVNNESRKASLLTKERSASLLHSFLYTIKSCGSVSQLFY
jgi:hypothetical protein